MTTLQMMAHAWSAWLWAASWQLALLTAVVTLLAWFTRHASPRFRHGLWLLVLLKCFLPPALTWPGSVGQWGIRPVTQAICASPELFATSFRASIVPTGPSIVGEREQAPAAGTRWHVQLFVIWSAGCAGFWLLIVWRYARVLHQLRRVEPIEEGPLRVELERIALKLDLRNVPELLVTELVTRPFLLGVNRPRIVLPAALFQNADDDVGRAVLTHELVHWQRRDTLVGWLQAAAQGLFWFHPCVWWASRQVCHERECVCDETVLRIGQLTPERYGQAIIHVLTSIRGRPIVSGNLVGVLERGARLQNRLEDVMNFDMAKREFGWPGRVALIFCACLLWPMAPGAVNLPVAVADEAAKTKVSPSAKVKTPHPQIVSSKPERGATGVDPTLTEVTVTFDRDMQKGMSWTGGPPLFPAIDKTRQARWINLRTCVLPVSLEKGNYYRVGINASSYQNFRSKDGTPAPSGALYFVTSGGSQELEARLAVPRIVKIEPENGAMDVDPATSTLQVTFNVVMGGGMSWTGGKQVPQAQAGKQAEWSQDKLTCILPVSLEPNREYVVSLNNLQHNNFQSQWGVPLEPVVYKFRTRGK